MLTEDERPLSEALVTATDILTETSRWTETGRTGAFEISALPPGTYEVRVEALGYEPRLYRSVSVQPGKAARLQVRLTLADPPVEEVDTVMVGRAAP
ncbi:MAG: carboxypeptidase regulatory-like domain-containing protein, partial [Actinobacteria bacterium]|nr:carboxypeptidase regulatory-like domain-containing protein [Actinomycetota bacterium]NIS30701.1 carboxypeptidase regulatory-like domain-containing protein [Actinomycetota bacterium]NIU65915.1 carboxypeptidase regulatory-like domain-containing protein [Actinomycetota bacterium]NIW27706.1 PEGA domain-containing protein [Actinomycetota bacterium]